MLLAKMQSSSVPLPVDIDVDESNKELEERIEELNDVISGECWNLCLYSILYCHTILYI